MAKDMNLQIKEVKEKILVFGLQHSYSRTEMDIIKKNNLFNTCIGGCKPWEKQYNPGCPVHGWAKENQNIQS